MSDQPKIKPTKPVRAVYEKWEAEGIPCVAVRLQQEAPPGKDKQPVGEFHMRQNGTKYDVDSLVYTPYGVIWRAYGEVDIMPLPNVAYARFQIK